MPDTHRDDFQTIAEAARQLGIDPRQVRRYADRLGPTDKRQDAQRTHKGQPVILVRVSAVMSLRDAQGERETAKDKGQDSHRTAKDNDLWERLVSEKDARILELSAALDSEREAHRRAELLHLNTQGELSELRRRAAELESMNARLVGLLPAMPTDKGQDAQGTATEGETMPPLSQNDAQDAPSALGEVLIPSDASTVNSEAIPRRWWQFWKGTD